MLTIGEFGRQADLTVKALRLYDGLGLLVPAEVDPYSGRRSYRPDQLERARLVSRLRLVGMPLAEIRTVADAPADTAARLVREYWRQVEADTAVRARLVSDLVEHLSTKEIPMSPSGSGHPGLTLAVATRSGAGARDAQLDAQAHGSSWAAVADGFGTADVATVAMAAVARQLGTTVERADLESAAVAAVRESAEAVGDSGSTLTVAALIGSDLVVAHLGDSRCSVLSDGTLEQLTTDHTYVAALVAAGRLDPAEVPDHPHQFLLNRALGPGRADVPDVAVRPVAAGDRVLLTTDGVHAVVPADRLATLVAGPDRDRVVDAVAAAVEAADCPDNWTILVADVV